MWISFDCFKYVKTIAVEDKEKANETISETSTLKLKTKKSYQINQYCTNTNL